MTELLCVPFKRSLKVDLKGELSKVIDSTFYQTSSFFEDDLDNISLARERMCDLDVSESSLEDLKRYWLYLICLQKKFPDYQIQFTWFQTLSPKSYACSQYSLVYERLNVLYNIGCMYSILALDANDGTASSLKKLCLYFQYSAGCFQYIVDHLDETKEPIFDKNTGLALIRIMLGQAQECFWFRALKDSHKDSLIARLAQQVVDYYDEAAAYSRKSELIRSHWVLHLESKKHYFEAVVDYRNGLALGVKNEHGAMVKSLSAAVDHLKKSEMPSKTDFMKTVTEGLRNSQRDNDFIYLQPIPSGLEKVKPAPMVKPLSISDFLEISFKQEESLFKDLLPITVMESCTGYNERQEEYITQNIANPLLALNKLLNDDIPKFEVPQNVKPVKEQDLGHSELVLSHQKRNHDTVDHLLREVRNVLEEEAETDDQLRKRFGTLNWKVEESAILNKPFYGKLGKLSEYAKQGKAVDDETSALFQAIDKRLITAPIKLPESKNPVVQKAFTLMKDRERYIQNVQAKSLQYRILPKIVSEYKKTGDMNFEPLFRSHIKFFDQDIEYVEKQKVQNKEMSKSLRNQVEETSVKRLEPYELYIEDLKYSLNVFEEVQKNIESGTQFYTDLLQSLSALLSEAREFETNRREQKRDLEKKLNGQH